MVTALWTSLPTPKDAFRGDLLERITESHEPGRQILQPGIIGAGPRFALLGRPLLWGQSDVDVRRGYTFDRQPGRSAVLVSGYGAGCRRDRARRRHRTTAATAASTAIIGIAPAR